MGNNYIWFNFFKILKRLNQDFKSLKLLKLNLYNLMSDGN